MVNDSERTRAILKRIGFIAIIVILCVAFKGKFLSVIDGLKSRYGTPVLEDGPTGGNVNRVEDEYEASPGSGIEVIYVITESSVNIREDAGVEFSQIATANGGTEFIGTGNTKEASNGRVWYEIYLNDDRTELGWVSSKVSKIKE